MQVPTEPAAQKRKGGILKRMFKKGDTKAGLPSPTGDAGRSYHLGLSCAHRLLTATETKHAWSRLGLGTLVLSCTVHTQAV